MPDFIMTAPSPKTLNAKKKDSEAKPDNKICSGANPKSTVAKIIKTAGTYSGTNLKTHIIRAAEKITTKLAAPQDKELHCKLRIKNMGTMRHISQPNSSNPVTLLLKSDTYTKTLRK